MIASENLRARVQSGGETKEGRRLFTKKANRTRARTTKRRTRIHNDARALIVRRDRRKDRRREGRRTSSGIYGRRGGFDVRREVTTSRGARRRMEGGSKLGLISAASSTLDSVCWRAGFDERGILGTSVRVHR